MTQDSLRDPKVISELLNEAIGAIPAGKHTPLLRKLMDTRDALIYNPEHLFPVGDNLPEAAWGGLARDLMMWLDMEPKTPEALFRHLRACGREIPQWLKDEPELQHPNHVPSKGTRVAIIWKAVNEQLQRFKIAQPEPSDKTDQPANRSTFKPQPITSWSALINWLTDIHLGKWTWVRNSKCKYVEIRLDTRSGAYVFKDRDGNYLTFDDVTYQYGKDNSRLVSE